MDLKEEKTSEQTVEERSSASSDHSGTPAPVALETYLYYAALQRAAEAGSDANPHAGGFNSWLNGRSAHKGPNANIDAAPHLEKHRGITLSERETASRALRLASWSSVFYLITTDILGPFNAPFAISQVGWVPGIILYFIMGLVALYTGLILWRLFVRLDSLRYPVLSYADLAERIFGTWARRVSLVLQSLQLVVFVGIICLGNAQALTQVAKHRLCFSICIVIWAFLGMLIGQIRTLKNYGWLANSAVWINLLIIFTSMGFVAHSPPNFAAALSSLGVPQGPVQTQTFAKIPLFSQVNGIMNMVYAYGGAMIFPEIMAEMRRPMDFWKGMVMAQSLIFTAYLIYGAFIYSQQGQFVLPLAYQGVSKYAWQTVGNVMSLVTGIIAGGLYGNIGIKVVYHNLVEDWFQGPPLMSHRGRIIWSILVVAYWALAFVIGSAIPQIQTINGLVGAIGIMQFTYTFPPLLRLGYDVLSDAMAGDKPYDPDSGASYHRVDTWRQWSRWRRGLFSGHWYFKLFNFILFSASLSMAGLGGHVGCGRVGENDLCAVGSGHFIRVQVSGVDIFRIRPKNDSSHTYAIPFFTPVATKLDSSPSRAQAVKVPSALISKKKKRRDKHGSKDEGPDALEKQTKRKRETVDVDETDAALAADRKQKKKKKHGERSDAVDVERLEPFSATFPITEQEDKEKRKKEKKRKRDTDDSAAVSHSDVVVAEEHVEKKKKKKKSKDKKCDTDDPGVVSISDAVAQENNRNEGAIGSSAPQVSAEVVENESVEEKRKKKRKRDAEQASLEGNTLVGPDGAAEEPALKKKKKSKGRETEREQKKAGAAASPLPQNSVSAVFNADFDSNDDILRVIQGLDMTTFEGGTPEPVPVASSSRSRKASSSSKPKRAKAAASQLNLNHAELLATKWMTPKQLDDLAKTEGLVFKKGKFAATEIKLLNDAIENYRKTRSLAESDIVNLVFPSDDTQKDPTFWTEITSALDQRPIRAVWNYLRRACNDAGRQGKWKADEDARLIQAVTSLGQQWEKVSELVGRMAGDCKDRYRNHIVDLDKREYGE
ncbi:unnamed protein product [Mycena citricolor]|uniref:Myb-like domain-containing protein n=1 Tax=Mycena citricolor TaxID=2018698 RepID=A0AAD2H4C6_9AGAR|nr:unnamed protein product [Mycena citricolor]